MAKEQHDPSRWWQKGKEIQLNFHFSLLRRHRESSAEISWSGLKWQLLSFIPTTKCPTRCDSDLSGSRMFFSISGDTILYCIQINERCFLSTDVDRESLIELFDGLSSLLFASFGSLTLPLTLLCLWTMTGRLLLFALPSNR